MWSSYHSTTNSVTGLFFHYIVNFKIHMNLHAYKLTLESLTYIKKVYLHTIYKTTFKMHASARSKSNVTSKSNFLFFLQKETKVHTKLQKNVALLLLFRFPEIISISFIKPLRFFVKLLMTLLASRWQNNYTHIMWILNTLTNVFLLAT